MIQIRHPQDKYLSHKDTVVGHDGLIIVTKGKDRISTVIQQ